MSPEKRYKRQERRVAKLLGGKRNPQDGSGKPDVESNWLVVEVKDRKELPLWILKALQQARAKAGPRRLGIATLTSPSTPEILVVMSLRDFREWHGWVRR